MPPYVRAGVIGFDRVAVVLLASGLSRRFGRDDKLLTPWRGTRLALHAAATLNALPFLRRVVVRPAGPDPLAARFADLGFGQVSNPTPEQGQGRSLALGIAAARAAGPAAILVCLADMPLVSADHLTRLLAAFDPEHVPAVASGTDPAGPPALFGAALFDALEAIKGDRGARALLTNAVTIEAPPEELRDFDRPEDFTA